MIIEQMRRELESSLPQDEPTTPLFHYTDAYAFLSILKDRQFWATDHRFLNDADEMLIGERLIRQEAEEVLRSEPDRPWYRWLIENFLATFDSFALTQVATIFVSSLSEEGNLLSQWRSYGANGAGYSIGLSRFRVPRGDPDNAIQVLRLARCLYDAAEFRAAVRGELKAVCSGSEKYILTYGDGEEMRESMAREFLSLIHRRLALHVPRMKHSSFGEEREWRLVAIPIPARDTRNVDYRASPRGVIPYVRIDLADDGQPLPLARVYVGSTQGQRGVSVAQQYLTKLGYAPELVTLSEIPYKGTA